MEYNDPFSEHNRQDALLRYVKLIRPAADDPTYSVLKAHLLFEEQINEFVSTHVKHPAALVGARLSFSQTLALARAIHLILKPENWQWEALQKLNTLRNRMAHVIEVDDMDRRVNDLAEFIGKHIKMKIPTEMANRTQATNDQSAINYTMLDILLGGLYAEFRAFHSVSLEAREIETQKARVQKE